MTVIKNVMEFNQHDISISMEEIVWDIVKEQSEEKENFYMTNI